LFDPAVAVSERVEKQWWPKEAGDGNMHFLVSKDSHTFRELLETLFANEHKTIEVIT
jgi:hypothetical protein